MDMVTNMGIVVQSRINLLFNHGKFLLTLYAKNLIDIHYPRTIIIHTFLISCVQTSSSLWALCVNSCSKPIYVPAGVNMVVGSHDLHTNHCKWYSWSRSSWNVPGIVHEMNNSASSDTAQGVWIIIQICIGNKRGHTFFIVCKSIGNLITV